MKSPAKVHEPKSSIVCFWTEVHGDRVMLTMDAPKIGFIKKTKILDAFSVEGERLDVRHCCRDGTRRAINSRRTKKVLAHLVPTRVRMTFEVIDKHLLVDSDLHKSS